MDTSSLYKKRFDVLHEGSAVLPVTDGTYFTSDNMPEGFENAAFVIVFYDASGDAVAPTGGTITPQMSPAEGQWHSSSNTPTITASQAGPTATYEIPVFPGPSRQGRVTFASIAGADHARAHFWRGTSI